MAIGADCLVLLQKAAAACLAASPIQALRYRRLNATVCCVQKENCQPILLSKTFWETN
jgi:hypothetical protein